MPEVVALYRYPVKGFTPQSCGHITVLPGGRVAGEALEDGVVLAIHGQDFRATGSGGGHHKFAGEHENLLRGQREFLAGG